MAGSPTVARKRSEKFSGNIDKRGLQKKAEAESKKEEGTPVNSTVVLVLLFIVVGSLFAQILQSVGNQPTFDE